MALVGPAIPVGAPVATTFDFPQYRVAVNAQIRFFSDAAGLVPIAYGTGSATLTATNRTAFVRGPRTDPSFIGGVSGTAIESGYAGGTIAGAVGGVWQEFTLGAGSTSLTITPSVIVPPGGAVTYAIVIDTEVRP